MGCQLKIDRRIVAKVEQLMALVDALETPLAASRATGANLSGDFSIASCPPRS